MTSVRCLRTGSAFMYQIVIVSRAYGGREAEPIDNRLEPKFGTERRPRGDDFRGMPTHEYRILASYRNCIAGIRRAGGNAHRPPTRTEVRHGRRPQRDAIREMPTHDQFVTAVIYRHIFSRAYGGRGDRAHRPPTRTGVRHGRRPTGGCGPRDAYTRATNALPKR